MSLPSELPEQPQLRAAAMALEQARMIGAVLDHKWRTIFLSSEQIAVFPEQDRLECLTLEDADALGLDLAYMQFTPVGSPGANAKAQRDAGTIAVTEI